MPNNYYTRWSMKRPRRQLLLLLLIVSYCQAGLPQQSTADIPIGHVVMLSGQAFASGSDGTVRALSRRGAIYPGETIETEGDTALRVRLMDGANLHLGCESRLSIPIYRFDAAASDRVELILERGRLRTTLGELQGDRYRLQTPLASLSAEGADVEVAILERGEEVFAVFDGGMDISNSQGALSLGINASADFASLSAESAPRELNDYPLTAQYC